jgi:AraC family transcriptional regulator
METHGFIVRETVVRRAHSLRDSTGACGRISFVLEGALSHEANGRLHLCPAGSVLYRPPHVAYVERVLKVPLQAVWIEVGPERLECFRPIFGAGVDRHILLPIAFLSGMLAEIRALLGGDSPAALAEAVHRLIVSTARVRGRPLWFGHCLHLLHSDYEELALGISSVAASLAVHRATVAAGFRRHLSCTLGQYLRLLRVHEVLRRLTETDQALTAIAAATGFCDQSHLTRTMKQTLGLPPSEIRRVCRFVADTRDSHPSGRPIADRS